MMNRIKVESQEGEGVNIKEKNGGEFRTDLSVAQPPCTRCRHADVCDLPPQCHALRFFTQTGKRILPPMVYPGIRIEEPEPAPEPPPPQDQRGLNAEVMRLLNEFEKDMEKKPRARG